MKTGGTKGVQTVRLLSPHKTGGKQVKAREKIKSSRLNYVYTAIRAAEVKRGGTWRGIPFSHKRKGGRSREKRREKGIENACGGEETSSLKKKRSRGNQHSQSSSESIRTQMDQEGRTERHTELN